MREGGAAVAAAGAEACAAVNVAEGARAAVGGADFLRAVVAAVRAVQEAAAERGSLRGSLETPERKSFD